jgi:hypothetical protein
MRAPTWCVALMHDTHEARQRHEDVLSLSASVPHVHNWRRRCDLDLDLRTRKRRTHPTLRCSAQCCFDRANCYP